MSKTAIDAGRLIERVQVLRLTEKEPGVWSWEPERPARAQIELSTKRSLFSDIGIGARSAELVLRRQALSLHNALLWGGRHLFLTSIVPEGRTHLRAEAALVEPTACRLRATDKEPGMTFPGVITEKYARHAQEWPMSLNELELVLVVPKAIAIRPGRLVEARGAAWEVLVPHELDPYKNEYEIGRTVDL